MSRVPAAVTQLSHSSSEGEWTPGLRELVCRHFPEIQPNEGALQMANALLNASDVNLLKAVDKKAALEKIRKIGDLARELWDEFNNLPPMVQMPLTMSGVVSSDEAIAPIPAALRRLRHQLEGKDPWPSSDNVKRVTLPDFDGGVAQARQWIEGYHELSYQERDSDFIGKVQLVQAARILWKHHNDKAATLKPSDAHKDGTYYCFVDDIIKLTGNNWGIDRALAALAQISRDTPADILTLSRADT